MNGFYIFFILSAVTFCSHGSQLHSNKESTAFKKGINQDVDHFDPLNNESYNMVCLLQTYTFFTITNYKFIKVIYMLFRVFIKKVNSSSHPVQFLLR